MKKMNIIVLVSGRGIAEIKVEFIQFIYSNITIQVNKSDGHKVSFHFNIVKKSHHWKF